MTRQDYLHPCIAASLPSIQLQFFIEPLAFPDITELCKTYGQTVLNTVYYCARTYVYYIHREKEILLCKWRGDMTVKSVKNSKVLTFRIPTRQPSAANNSKVSSNINSISVTVMQKLPTPSVTPYLSTTDYHYPLVTTNSTCSALYPVTVAGLGVEGGDLFGDSNLLTGLDCPGGAVGCSCGERAVGDCLSGEYAVHCDNCQPKPASYFPRCSTSVGAGCHGPGANISPPINHLKTLVTQ